MKALVVLLLFLAGSLRAAPEKFLAADEVLKADGSLTLTDGGSFFVFLKDETFRSFPAGFSGRTLKGKWSSHGTNPVIFTVKAEASWINGLSGPGDHRKIVFIVYNGFKRPAEKQILGGKVPNGQVWGGYFLIDEFVRLGAPDRSEQLPGLSEPASPFWPELDTIRVILKPVPPPVLSR